MVFAARNVEEGTVAREALATLCSTYWYPLYAFVRRQGASAHDAEDLTQEFFYRFLENDVLRKATPAAGRFRSFLLTCLKRFLINEQERNHAQRRGGGQPLIPLDAAAGEAIYLSDQVENVTPEVLFERHWAFTVLEQAVRRLEQEYCQRGQSELFRELRGFLPGSGGEPLRSAIASAQGLSTAALDVAIHRVRRRFAAALRDQVAQTVSSPGEVEEEIQYLIAALGK